MTPNSLVAKREPQIPEEAFKLKSGETGKMLKTNICYILIHCVEYTPEKSNSFEAAKQSLSVAYLQAEFDKLISNVEKNTKVDINYYAYDKK